VELCSYGRSSQGLKHLNRTIFSRAVAMLYEFAKFVHVFGDFRLGVLITSSIWHIGFQHPTRWADSNRTLHRSHSGQHSVRDWFADSVVL